MENSITSVARCECEIVRIVYRQALTGFTVCEVRQVQSLVSPVLPLVFKAVCVSPAELLVGARCDLEGVWEAGKYGMQLKVARLSPVRTPTVEGALQYLQSGLVYGIGPGLARRIVTRFGLDTMRILESDPERLLEVPGIGRQTVDHLIEVLQVRGGQAEALGALLQLGLTIGLAQRVLHHFGGQAPETVRRDPYRLSEVWGIGFLRADEIARRIGVQPESSDRICAGLRYVLESEAEKGHSCVRSQALVEAAVELLAVGSAHVSAGLRAAMEAGVVIANGSLVYLSRHYEAEREIERRVRVLIQQPVANVVPEAYAGTVVLTEAQQEAVRRALSYPLSVLTGLPGTGKTTVVKTMVAEALRRGQRVALAAPTWQAAQRLTEVTGHEASTVHRLIEWNLQEAPRRDAASPIGLWCGSPVVYGGEEAPLDSYRPYAEIVHMTRRWTFRAYPTETQVEHLAQTFGCCRLVYNGMLAARTAAFQRGERLTYAGSDKKLTLLKRDPELAFLNDVSSVPLQQSLRHLQTAFVNFFATRSAYPTFKKKGRTRDSATYTRSACRFDCSTQRLTLAKLGVLNLRISRRVEVIPTSVTVTRHPSGRYYVSMVIEIEAPTTKRIKTGQSIGIDFGLSRLATLSNGEPVPNPKHLFRRTALLARAQRRLSKKQKGSHRRLTQARRVARLHEQIADARRDSLHKLSTSLVRRFDSIYLEDLNLRGMVKNHNLARSLSDASIGTAIRMIEAKAEASGVSVVKIDRWCPSSKQCSACGHVLDALPLSVRRWTCPRCHSEHDRDVNARPRIFWRSGRP